MILRRWGCGPGEVAEWSLPGHHRDGLPLEIDVRLAADVDCDAVDRTAGELVRVSAGVVAGDRFAAVSSDAEAFAGDRELARLGLDAALADLLLTVVERQDPGRDAGRVLAVLLEVGGQDQLVADRYVL